MSVSRQLSRQWVPIVGGSCDVRSGADALHAMAKVLKDSVPRPHTCMVVVRAGEEAELLEEVRRQVVDAGFAYHLCELQMPVRTFDAAGTLAKALMEAGATADDLCCAVGDADLISVASYVCGSWCQGMQVVALPLDELGFFEGALVPRALDVGGVPGMVAVRPAVRHVVLDLDRTLGELDSEPARHARVLMVAAAFGSSEKEFSALWDKAGDIMADDGAALCAQLLATAKARGKLAASTAAAVRSSINYGRSFANACAGLVPGVSFASLLAEGMRFCARLSVAQGKLDLDDMLAQDELLDVMGVGPARCEVKATDLVEAFRRERLLRSRKLMLELPLAMGRIRLATVDDGMVVEHIHAWCAAHHDEEV